jgi:hypothetical protein
MAPEDNRFSLSGTRTHASSKTLKIDRIVVGSSCILPKSPPPLGRGGAGGSTERRVEEKEKKLWAGAVL